MDAFRCSHGEAGHCFACSKELRKNGIFVIKAGSLSSNTWLKDLSVVRTFKTETAAKNYCEKMNAKQSELYYTFVVKPKKGSLE